MISFTREIVVEADAIKKAYQKVATIEVPSDLDIANLFFYDDYHNDSYKDLYFGEDADKWDNGEGSEHRIAIRAMLRKEFPDSTSILVDTSW